MHPIFNYIDKAWPLGASVLAGAVAFGSLSSDVTDLRNQQSVTAHDHDAIVRIEQSQADMKTDLADIKSTLHKIEQNR